jgi:hypothetical protein
MAVKRLKFTETVHCKSRANCTTCRSDKKWRGVMRRAYDWDGRCPLTKEQRDKEHSEAKEKNAKRPGCRSCGDKNERR